LAIRRRESARGSLLQPDGTYLLSETSRNFPFFPMFEFERFLLQVENEGEFETLRSFMQWFREQNFPSHPG
jgi:hypothetical protein